jgi:hypothetical protein
MLLRETNQSKKAIIYYIIPKRWHCRTSKAIETEKKKKKITVWQDYKGLSVRMNIWSTGFLEQ